MESLKYPIGRFSFQPPSTPEQRAQWIDDIAETPARLRAAVAGLNDAQLATPYREGGWTVRQVIHHVADSHINSYVRFRLALTEDEPLIKPYEEAEWAKLEDAAHAPVEISLTLLDALHTRWVRLLRTLASADFQKKFRHPELGEVSLEKNVALYSWHGKHHTAHITRLRERMQWP